MKKFKEQPPVLSFEVIKHILSFLDIESKAEIICKGVNIEKYIDFDIEGSKLFHFLIDNEKFYFKTIALCLMRGVTSFPTNSVNQLDSNILKFYLKIERMFSKIMQFKYTKNVLILIGSFKCLKFELDSLEILNFLICYFNRVLTMKEKIKIVDYELIVKILGKLSRQKSEKNLIFLFDNLLKILPDCFYKEYCEVIHNFDIFHYVHGKEMFMKQFFKKYPGFMFMNCVKRKGFLRQLSLSIINWNNELLPVIYNNCSDVLILIGDAYINRQFEKGEEQRKISFKKMKTILNSTNKFSQFLSYVKGT